MPHRDGQRFVVRADEMLYCFSGTAKGDSPIRGEFDVTNHFVVAVWTAGEAKSATYENECSASNSYSLAHMLRVFATGRGS